MDRKITFGDYALSWLDRQVLKPSTYDSYKAILTKHLLPAFGHVPFASLTRPMLKDYLERKQASNRWARQTIHNVRTVLRGIIADAHDSGYVTTNIADRLRLKRRQVAPVSSWGEKEDMDQHFSPLEWEEVQHLLAVARDRYLYPYPYYPLFVLAIFAGLRRGELCALHWGDVVLQPPQPVLQVRKSIYRGKLYPPKTQSSVRDVPLFSWPLQVLREWRQASPFSQDSNPVFPTVTGNLIHPDNMLKRYFYPTLKAAGLRRIRFHDLRGTYASLIVNWGFAPKQLQQWMGHATFDMTMDIYAKCLREVPERFHQVDGFITGQFTKHTR